MGLEEAMAASPKKKSLGEKITENFSPDEIEQLRSKLYEKVQGGNKDAVKFLQALPTKRSSLSAPGSEKRLDTGGPSELEPTRGPSNPTTPLRAAQGVLQKAFPKQEKSVDPWQSDELAGMIGTGAMLAPIMAPAAAVLGEAAPALGEFIGGVGGTVAKGATKLAGGAGMGAGAAVLTEGDPKTGAIMGGLAALPGAALSGMRDPRLPTGQIYQDLERGGGTVGLTRPARGGMFNSQEYRSLPAGERGTNRMATGAADAIEESVEARRVAAKDMIDDAETDASVRLGDTRLPTDEIRARIASMRSSNVDAMGRVRDAGLERELAAIDERLQMTRQARRPMNPAEQIPTMEDVDVPTNEITFNDALRLKKHVSQSAEHGQPGTPQNRPARRIEGATSDVVRGADEGYDAAVGRYADETGRLERINDVTVGRDIAETGDRASMQRARVSTMEKAGTDRLKLQQLEELIAQNPNIAPLIQRMIARNAATKLEFGMPDSARPWTIAGRNLTAAGVRGVDALGRASNANYPLIPLEVAAYENGQKKRKADAEARIQFLDTGE